MIIFLFRVTSGVLFANFKIASLFFSSLLVFISMDGSGCGFFGRCSDSKKFKGYVLSHCSIGKVKVLQLIKTSLVYFKPPTSTTVTAGFPHALLEGYTGLFK